MSALSQKNKYSKKDQTKCLIVDSLLLILVQLESNTVQKMNKSFFFSFIGSLSHAEKWQEVV